MNTHPSTIKTSVIAGNRLRFTRTANIDAPFANKATAAPFKHPQP